MWLKNEKTLLCTVGHMECGGYFSPVTSSSPLVRLLHPTCRLSSSPLSRPLCLQSVPGRLQARRHLHAARRQTPVGVLLRGGDGPRAPRRRPLQDDRQVTSSPPLTTRRRVGRPGCTCARSESVQLIAACVNTRPPITNAVQTSTF